GCRRGLRAVGRSVAVARADHVRRVLRVVEMGRVCGFVAAHAGGPWHLELDGRCRLVFYVIAAVSMAVLALYVLPPDPLAVETGSADMRPVAAADATGLRPPRDVAADAVVVELVYCRQPRGGRA